MHQHYDAIIASPVGFLGLKESAGALTRIEFLGEQASLRSPRSALLQEAEHQIAAWFADPAFGFDLPYRLDGSEFRRRVWAQIATIPRGTVQTYAEIARALGSAPRPVGGACGANPLPLLIPCHRVVAAHGLGGFNARRDGVDWLPIKRWLLANEHAL